MSDFGGYRFGDGIDVAKMLKNHFLVVNFAYICFHYVKVICEYKGVKLVEHESFKSIKEI